MASCRATAPPARRSPASGSCTGGAAPFDRLITHYPLDEINRAAADCLGGEVVKPVLLMQETGAA